MKLQELLENNNDIIFNEIKENTVYDKSVPIYRALSGKKYANIGKAEIRKDREPVSSSLYSTIIFNELFKQIHGIDNIRNIALFAGNTYNIAKTYLSVAPNSSVNYIFPNNGSKFIFKPGLKDSFGEMDLENKYEIRSRLWSLNNITFPIDINQLLKIVKEQIPESYEIIEKGIFNSLSKEKNKKVIREYNVTSNISDIPSTPTEIMIIGDYYYYINVDNKISYEELVEKEL